MNLIKKIKDKKTKLENWFTSSLSIPNFEKNLEMGPYFDFIKNNCKNIKGDIIEFGVYRGDSIISAALLLERLNIKKKIIGLDTFGGFPKKHKLDNPMIFHELYKKKQISKKHYFWFLLRNEAIKKKLIINHNWEKTSYKFVNERIKKFKLKKMINLIKGDIKFSVNKIDNQQKYSVALLDCNLYEPHKFALEYVWDRMSKNGYIYLDDYFSLKYPGPRIAINQFCNRNNIKINKMKNYHGDFERYFLIKK